jgi:hypothetical protein
MRGSEEDAGQKRSRTIKIEVYVLKDCEETNCNSAW